jgi:MFS family permease
MLCNYNYFGQSISFTYVQGYFGVTMQDANWLLRGFHAGTIITGIAGLVFIKWLGNRKLFIGAAIVFLAATVFSFNATDFNTLLNSRIIAGIANGFMIAVAMQLFLATFEGKTKSLGALYTVAATIGGVCLGIFSGSLFNEDFGWQFNYYLSVPPMILVIAASFFFVPSSQQHQEIEDDALSLIPFAVLIMSVLFAVMYRQQFEGLSNIKIVIALILAVVSAAVLLVRGAVHHHPLFDTRLLQYPSFIVAIMVSFFSGFVFVFSISLVVKLLAGVLGMSMSDVFHFLNFLVLIVFASMIITFILVALKANNYLMMITGLLLISGGAFMLSKLNPEFSFDNIIFPSIMAMIGVGMVPLLVIVIAIKSVPGEFAGKVANFRSVAFAMGIAITSVDLGRALDFRRVENFNAMIAYTDPGNPLLQERTEWPAGIL